MELPAGLEFSADLTVWDAERMGPRADARLCHVVDAMGNASARAQQLGAVITTAAKLAANPDQRLFLLVDREAGVAIGLLKVGPKRLFLRDGAARLHEVAPLCVLDFYVHESAQRRGIGRALFQAMLGAEGTQPHRLAYDRPSPKLLGFMAKHYGLKAYVEQSNNFVAYHSVSCPYIAPLPALCAPRLSAMQQVVDITWGSSFFRAGQVLAPQV